MKRQQRIYLGKKGYNFLRENSVSNGVIRGLQKLNSSIPIPAVQRELKRVSLLTPTSRR